MNTEIRRAVKAAIKSQEISQNEFAADVVGIRKEALSRMLSGEISNMPANWAKVLKAAGLELTVKKARAAPRKPKKHK